MRVRLVGARPTGRSDARFVCLIESLAGASSYRNPAHRAIRCPMRVPGFNRSLGRAPTGARTPRDAFAERRTLLLALAPHPDQHLDAFLLGAIRQGRHATDAYLAAGDIAQFARIDMIKMMMRMGRRVIEFAA